MPSQPLNKDSIKNKIAPSSLK